MSGELRVVSRYGPTTFYRGPNGPAGLEYDLARLFAQRLGVNLSVRLSGSRQGVEQAIADGEADVGAARLTAADRPTLRFGPAYRRVTDQVLYSEDAPRPQNLADLHHGILEVPAGSDHVDTLKELRRQDRRLDWRLGSDGEIAKLMRRANEGQVDYTLATSDQAHMMRRYYPKLRVAFEVGKPRKLAWALSRSEDRSLYNEVARFFADIRRNKTLDQLIDRYYGHAESFDPALHASLREDYRTRLPRIKWMFVRAGAAQGIDWRLLAAIAYQESKWKSTAVSAEGVRGMMQLTALTARELKVRDRFNPVESIAAGANYLRQTLTAIPAHIRDPDRTWYALAAYNLGYGHVQDAQKLVQGHGGDPNKWIEIKQTLPLLGHAQWYRKTRYGKARGSLAVHYVNSIRRYYELLVWITEEEENRTLAADGREAASGA